MIYTPHNYQFTQITLPEDPQPVIPEHLTEKNLEYFLLWLFHDSDIICNKRFPHGDRNIRPDYRIEKYKLIVEYDGPYHYTNPTNCKTDIEKNKIYNEYGYNVVRIPYYIQLQAESIYKFFEGYLTDRGYDSGDFEDFNDYPHGFVTDKVILPSSFCSLGLQRFDNDIKSLCNMSFDEEADDYDGFYERVTTQIAESLINKIIINKSIMDVIPNVKNSFLQGVLFQTKYTITDLFDKEVEQFNLLLESSVKISSSDKCDYKFRINVDVKYDISTPDRTFLVEDIGVDGVNLFDLANVLTHITGIEVEEEDIYVVYEGSGGKNAYILCKYDLQFSLLDNHTTSLCSIMDMEGFIEAIGPDFGVTEDEIAEGADMDVILTFNIPDRLPLYSI